MRSRKQAEDPAARAQRERDRRLSEISGMETGMETADGLTEDLRKVYGLRRLGRPGAQATPGVQPGAAPMPVVAQAQRETQMDRDQQNAAMMRLYQSSGSSLAPETSIRPRPNPNFGASLAPATSPRPKVSPNQKSLAPSTSIRPKSNPYR